MPRGRIRAFRFLDLSQLRHDSAVPVTDGAETGRDDKWRDSSDGTSSVRDALRMESHEILDLSAPRCLVLVKSTGEVHQVQASRLELAARFQIPQRDLRLLDPWVPVPIPVSFLVRKHAILANFGAVRVLISRCECAILSSGRVDDQYVLTEEPDVNDKLTEGLRQMSTVSPQEEAPGVAPRRAGDHLHLPFELRMLEVALDEACGLMGVEVRGVVASATSRMAVLQASVVRTLPHAAATRAAPAHCGPLLASSGMEDSEHELRGRMQQAAGNRTLEELKEIRSEAVKLSSRVGKFKSELEDVMQDDSDMLVQPPPPNAPLTLDMYLQRRHALSTAPAQLQGMHTMSGAAPGWVGSAGDGQTHRSVQGHTATFMPSRAHTRPLSADQGRGAVSFDDARPAKDDSATSSAPAVCAATPTGSAPLSPWPQQVGSDAQPAEAPWMGTVARVGSGGAAVGAPAGFGSAMSAVAMDVSEGSETVTGCALADMPEEGPLYEGMRAPDIPEQPFAIDVGPAGDRTEPLPSPFTRKGPPAATPETAAGRASQMLGLQEAARSSVQARSMEVGIRPNADDAPGPPTASQSLEPASSIPDKIMIGQRARRVTRVGKHGWEAIRPMADVATRIAETSPKSGVTTPDRAATAAVLRVGSPGAPGGRALRPSQTMLPQRQAGRGRVSGPAQRLSMHERTLPGDAPGPDLHSARSFSTDAEAVQLTDVPLEDPNELAARVEYARMPGLHSGAGLSMPNASAHSMALAASLPVGMAQSGHTQAFVGTGLPGQSSAQIPHGLDAVSNMVSDVASQRKSGIERSESVTSSSSRSTEILNHLLDLKQQAGQANTAVNPHDIQDVENMLEAYSLQLDYYMAQLGDLSEFIDDFQVDLDKKRNALFAGQLLITLITAGFSFIAMVAGIFGMNLNSGVETANGWFLGVTVLSAGLAVSVTVGLVAFLRYHRMLFLGD